MKYPLINEGKRFMPLSEVKQNLLEQLVSSRERILAECDSNTINVSELYKLANTEACSALSLMPVPTDPVERLIHTHKQAYGYLRMLHRSSGDIVKSGA